MSHSQLAQTTLTLNRNDVDAVIESTGLGYDEFRIEEFWAAVDLLESKLQFPYVRMDFGVPGLMPPESLLKSHQISIQEGVIPQQYPPHSGVATLNKEVATFLQNRIDTAIEPEDIFVTCGATQALFIAQAVAAKMKKSAKGLAFLTPNYPPMCSQALFLGMDIHQIEVDGKRGQVLLDAIESVFLSGEIASFCWASPSNPGWTMLDEDELRGIAALCHKYQVIPIEDLTYLGMIKAKKTGEVPVLPSIAKYTHQYFLVLSTSKMLSYAGERIGFLVGATSLLAYQADALQRDFGFTSVRRACGSLIFNITGGASHSAQYAVQDIFHAINTQKYNVDAALNTYLSRAERLKSLLQENGFYLVYENAEQDQGGFYVSFAYPGLTEMQLLQSLLYIGVTVLPLSIFGSQRIDGVRACVGRLSEQKLTLLSERLPQFKRSIS